MTIKNLSLGEQLKYYRNLKGLSQARLAEMVFASPQTINNYEQEHRTISAKMLFTLGEILDFRVTMEQGEIKLIPHTTNLTNDMLMTIQRDLNGFLAIKSPSTIGGLKEGIDEFLKTHEWGPFRLKHFLPLSALSKQNPGIGTVWELDWVEFAGVFNELPQRFNSAQALVADENGMMYLFSLTFELNLFATNKEGETDELQPLINEFIEIKNLPQFRTLEELNKSSLPGYIPLMAFVEWITHAVAPVGSTKAINLSGLDVIDISKATVKGVHEIDGEVMCELFDMDSLAPILETFLNGDLELNDLATLQESDSSEVEVNSLPESEEEDILTKVLLTALRKVLKKEGYTIQRREKDGEFVTI